MSEEKKKKGLFARLREGLSKTRGNMTEKVDEMVRDNRKIDEDFYEELEDILVMADCGLKATTVIIDELRVRVKKGNVKEAAEAREILKQIMVEQMDIPRPPLKWPMVMLMVGVNGVGKTTTIGKLALRFQSIGRKVMLCAGDTFQAAAAEQLTVWAERARVPIVKHEEGADPAAVVFDAIQSAKAQQADLLIVDTAGRLHNKKNLMDELNKMRRVIDREYPEADTRCILVLDATTGQNGLQQARAFKEVAEIGGIILTRNMDEACDIVNNFAPEHLEIMTKNPAATAEKIVNAGEILLGSHTPFSAANYSTGPNAVLPTGGTAKTFSAVSVRDFVKYTSVIQMDEKGYKAVEPHVKELADYEGFITHGNAFKLRRL